MLNQYRLKWKWHKLRLHIWQKRLQSELESTMSDHSIDLPVSLQVSWGAFYNGAAFLNRDLKKAKILLQIPYDQYVTEDELHVMERYRLSSRELPYFILYHEIFHLLDALSLKNEESMTQKLRDHYAQAKQTTSYRSLVFEQAADEFAYRCFREKRGKACYTYEKVLYG